jgi:hypothetical protein
METATTTQSFLLNGSMLSQVLLTIAVLLAIYIVFTMIDSSVSAINETSKTANTLLKDTYSSSQVIPQSLNSGFPLIYPSSNEKNGMEFSYSFHLNLSPETFNSNKAAICGASTDSTGSGGTSTVLKHIFSKGTEKSFPLMAPGLFARGDINTLRIYMNSTTTWNNYVEIPNIPIGKWFHVVISLKGKYLDVYINGNVAVRHEFKDVPKLNYGPVYIFNNTQFPDGTSTAIKDFVVNGASKGMISRLQYYAYALNYSQIDSLYREGASAKMGESVVSVTPPYLADNWWTGSRVA